MKCLANPKAIVEELEIILHQGLLKWNIGMK